MILCQADRLRFFRESLLPNPTSAYIRTHVCLKFFSTTASCSAHVAHTHHLLTSSTMFATKFTAALLFALVSSATVSASAIWNPKILSPDTQTVWVRGQTTEVTWSVCAQGAANVS